VRTVILPNEEINRLGLELEELKCFLNVQKALYEETISGYEKDRVIREQEFELKKQDFEEKKKELVSRLEQRQGTQYSLNKNYFEYKYEIQQTKNKMQDEYELLKVENSALKAQMDKILSSEKVDTKYAVDLYD